MEYIASGGIKISGTADWSGPILGGAMGRGCAIIEYIDHIPTPFNVGDVLYSKSEAKRGEFYKIRIKEVHPFVKRKSWGTWHGLAPDGLHQKNSALYVCTNNSFWNQWDLVTYAEASVLIDEFVANRLRLFYKKNRC
jgi:hypothetical protein